MFVFCKVNVLLFSSLLNMIIGSVGKWSVVGGSVVGGFNKTRYNCVYIQERSKYYLIP